MHRDDFPKELMDNVIYLDNGATTFKPKIVLDKMHELGKEDSNHKAAITEEEYQTAIAELENGLAFNKGTITSAISFLSEVVKLIPSRQSTKV